MQALFRKVDCLSLKVPNLEEAIAFYVDKLGHRLKWKSSTAAGLSFPESDAELVLHTDDRSMETDLLVNSVPEAVARFTRAGGTVLTEPFDIPVGMCAVVSDPWANRLVILDLSKGLLKTDENLNVIEDGA